MRTVKSRLVLMDFGIAWMFDPSMSEKGALIGSPIYMSPEQLERGNVTGQTDIYSLGTVIFEYLTGSRPFRGNDFDSVMDAKISGRRIPLAELNPTLPPSLEGFFDRALARNLKVRFASGNELILINPAPHDLYIWLSALVEKAGPSMHITVSFV